MTDLFHRSSTRLTACAVFALVVGTALPLAAQAQNKETSATTAASSAVASTPPADLRVTHYTRNIGKDGVQRESTYTTHVYRRANQLWIERELPANLKASLAHGHEHAHGPHAGHAHDEAEGAPLLLQRNDQGEVTVKVILEDNKRVITVDTAHHGNVGYGGSWDAAYWLVPPASLKAMQPQGSVRSGVQRYTRTQDERTITVDWDVKGQYPHRIEQKDAHGTAYYRLTAERLPSMPDSQRPWASIGNYDQGDYSDLLD